MSIMNTSGRFLPCPFCGGGDIRYDEHRTDLSPTGAVFSMCCYKCGASFPNRYKLELLVDAWNRRVESIALPTVYPK